MKDLTFSWGAFIWQSGDGAGRRGCDTRRCSLFTVWMHFSAGLRTRRSCADGDGTKLLPSVVLDQPVLLALRIAHIPSAERMPSDYLKEAERVLALCKLFVSGSETKCRGTICGGIRSDLISRGAAQWQHTSIFYSLTNNSCWSCTKPVVYLSLRTNLFKIPAASRRRNWRQNKHTQTNWSGEKNEKTKH